MAVARRALLGLTAVLAAGGLMVTSATGAPAEADEEPPAASADVVYKHVWRTASSHEERTRHSPTGGSLYAGNNYFYCQNNGRPFSAHGYENNYWLLTDDDHGNRSVWVSAVYLSGGNDNEPIEGVRACRPAEVAAAGGAPGDR